MKVEVLVFMFCEIEKELDLWQISQRSVASLHAPPCQPLMKCKRVFQALITIAIEELCQMANALIVPVRMGVARPTAPFALVSINSDAVQVSVVCSLTKYKNN